MKTNILNQTMYSGMSGTLTIAFNDADEGERTMPENGDITINVFNVMHRHVLTIEKDDITLLHTDAGDPFIAYQFDPETTKWWNGTYQFEIVLKYEEVISISTTDLWIEFERPNSAKLL